MTRQTPETRFWNKVSKGEISQCWEWKAKKDKDGYGIFWLDGKNRRAHRISYEWCKEKPPANLLVMHECDNPPCVNPAHLLIGTCKENLAQMIKRGRCHRIGQGKKLTEKQEAAIRKKYKPRKNGGIYKLAKQYRVSPVGIWRVVNTVH